MRGESTLSFTTGIAIGIAAIAVSAIAACPVYAQSGQGKPATKPAKPKPIPGGANQVSGLNGKLGDMLWDGRWRFQVQEIKEVSTYTLTVPNSQQDYARYHTVAHGDPTTHVYTPKEGNTFIVLKCLARNGQKTVQQLDFYSPEIKTALTDDQSNSYQPIVYDMQSDGAWTTKKLLPGSAVTMTILFAVPPGTKPKDLVFSLKNWSDKKVNNLRIALPAAAVPPPAPAEPAPL